MSIRAEEMEAFLVSQGWAEALRTPLSADFSSRRYLRLARADGQKALLMDAAADQNTSAFVAVDRLLRAVDLSAPVIFAEQADRGLVLMEDFGDRNVGRLLEEGADALPFYRRAAEVLARLHRCFVKPPTLSLPVFSARLFTEQAELFLDFYVPWKTGRVVSEAERQAFRQAWLTVLTPLDLGPQSLLLRDYMPDNLMDLPERTGWKALGVLDFQDAGMGPVAYDLASLCETVRRDGGDAMLEPVLAYYRELVGESLPQAEMLRACQVLSAQRHVRILGILARMAQTGRTDKLVHVARVEKTVQLALSQRVMAPVRAWMTAQNILNGV